MKKKGSNLEQVRESPTGTRIHGENPQRARIHGNVFFLQLGLLFLSFGCAGVYIYANLPFMLSIIGVGNS